MPLGQTFHRRLGQGHLCSVPPGCQEDFASEGKPEALEEPELAGGHQPSFSAVPLGVCRRHRAPAAETCRGPPGPSLGSLEGWKRGKSCPWCAEEAVGARQTPPGAAELPHPCHQPHGPVLCPITQAPAPLQPSPCPCLEPAGARHRGEALAAPNAIST